MTKNVVKKEELSSRKEFEDRINDWVTVQLPPDLKQYKVKDRKVIHDSVWGSHVFQKHEIAVLDTPIIQRLRRISQTGLVYLTFPSATHTRFEHTLGVCNLVSRFVRTLNDRRPFNKGIIDCSTDKGEYAEMKMAAILHDCGHSFFSHASEDVYKWHPVMQEFLIDDHFAHCKPHEIISHYIVKSKRFRDFFDNCINKEYKAEINLDVVAEMIIGRHPDEKKTFQAEIINGPFDADKLDYIFRDSFFFGITLTMDTERLFYTLELDEESFDRPYLIVRSPVPLEQILFSKMMLYTSIYHHQKVRASESMLKGLCEYIKHNNLKVSGRTLEHPVDFLYLTDEQVLNPNASDDKTFKRLVNNILDRVLLHRGVVICKDTVNNFEDCFEYKLVKLSRSSPNDLLKLRSDIFYAMKEKDCILQEILIDIPQLPSLREAAQTYTSVSLEQTPELINKIFPVDGWLRAYGSRKWRGHVFCPESMQKEVDKAARKVLGKMNIKVNDRSPLYCHMN